jgi:thioredoxin-like negative regulator of GroEL
MKKSLLSLAILLFVGFIAQAQEEGAKMAKSAGKALTSYNLDPSGNAAKLTEAKEKIDKALTMTDAQALPSAWLTQGEVYATILRKDLAMKAINTTAKMSGDNDALIAFNAFKKCYELATKKYDKSDAIKGIIENNLQGSLVNTGASKYEAKEYDKAFMSFDASLKSHDLLKESKEKSIFDEKDAYETQVYYTAVCAQLAKKPADAMRLYEQLYKTGNAKAEIYDGLYNSKLEAGDTEAASKILTEGRAKYPDDSALLFSEINVYIKNGKLTELTDRLKQAIAKEPKNVGLYVTLGNVYDNLYQKALEAKDEAATNSNFEEAKKYYTQGSDIDPKNVDAVYALGALYYNKAAIRTKELNAMPEDYSSAGMKKYETMKNEISLVFDSALPYFQKAEALDANDTNTLIALKEIYTRKEDDLALEFKKRLDVVQAGGKNTGSHFKQ